MAYKFATLLELLKFMRQPTYAFKPVLQSDRFCAYGSENTIEELVRETMTTFGLDEAQARWLVLPEQPSPVPGALPSPNASISLRGYVAFAHYVVAKLLEQDVEAKVQACGDYWCRDDLPDADWLDGDDN